ncbi:MAG: hypothetical protein SGPRY_014691 [Prymnesium sp.]
MLLFHAPLLAFQMGGAMRPLSAAPPVERAVVSASLSSFHAWLEANQLSTDKVVGKELPGFGLSLVAGERGVRTGDTLVSVPASLHFTPRSIEGTPLGEAVRGVIDDESALLALHLLQEGARGPEGSAHWPYLELLPSSEQMQARERTTQLILRGPHVARLRCYVMVESILSELTQQWSAIEQSALLKQPEAFPKETFTFEGYLWAHAIVLTRALPFGDSLSLIPFLDLANHESGAKNTCSIAMSKSDGPAAPVTEAWELTELGGEAAAVLTSGARLAAGEQVFIDYGEAGWRSSWEMLYTYGFVPGGDEDWLLTGGECRGDRIPSLLARLMAASLAGRPMFFEGISSSDSLAAQKKALLAALGVDESAADGTWVELKAVSRGGGEMAPFLRLAHLAEGEGIPLADALASWSASPQESWEALQQPLSPALEKRVAQVVLDKCEAAVELLPIAEELKKAAAPADGNETTTRIRERFAARVLLGERCALEACIGFWQRVLQ